jgi:hypothetical protein
MFRSKFIFPRNPLGKALKTGFNNKGKEVPG